MATNSALRSPAAQNLLAAAVAGIGVLARPGRIPTWARRGLTVANTAGTAGSLLMTDKAAAQGGALGLKPVNTTRDTAATTGSALAAAAGSLSLLTSGIGLKLDSKAENYLLKKGVRHPRIWMAVAAVGLVFAIKTIQDAAARKAETSASRFAETRKGPAAGAGISPSPTKPSVRPARAQVAANSSANSTANSTANSSTNSTAGTEPSGPSKPSGVLTQEQPSSPSTTISAPSGVGAATAADAADAPDAAPAASAEDTPIWKDVSERAQSGRHAAPQTAADDTTGAASGSDRDSTNTSDPHADSADADTASQVASQDPSTTSSDASANTDSGGHRPSSFEQQLAQTTVDDLDEPSVTDEGDQPKA